MKFLFGMEVNWIFWYFVLMAILVDFLCVSVNFGVVPNIIRKLFLYGKASIQTEGLVIIPKSWFKHFYIVGAFEVTYAMAQVIQVNIVGQRAPFWLQQTLLWLTANRTPSCSPESLVLAMCLLTAQIYRRLYEHLFVHVPSDTKIHLGHWLAGILHYVLGIAAILSEAPGFVTDVSTRRMFTITKLAWLDRICGAMFMLAWLHQYRANCIFADLRKSEAGEVVSRGHAIPRGDWFEYVSCPHYLSEVVMYTCLLVMLGPGHTTWLAVWLWVISNQVGSALMSHYWYKQKFEDYPADRRAIFPFLL